MASYIKSSPKSVPTDGEPRHDPVLDGIRGLAILSVLVCHLTENWNRGGNHVESAVFGVAQTGRYGVTLFFILSGFLITGILLRTPKTPGYFASFFGRRVVRIFPLYYAVLFVLFVVLPAMHCSAYVECRPHQLWLWTYSLNVANLMTHVNWGHLNHFWTLALEEQFYLLWPAVVWLCPRRALQWVCVAGIIGLTLIRVAVFAHDPVSRFNFALGNFDCDGLFFGSWLAARSRADGRDLTHLRRFALMTAVVSAIGVALILRSVLHSAPWTMTVKFPLITGLLGAAFVFIQSDPRRLLAHATLRFFGKYSYALYVLHYPLLPYYVAAFPMTRLSARCGYLPAVLIFLLGGIAGSVMLALLSWHLLEKHFLKLKRFFRATRRVTQHPSATFATGTGGSVPV